MTAWQVLAGPATAAPLAQVPAAGHRLVLSLLGPSSCQFSVNGESEAAANLTEATADVHVLRDRVPVFTGRLGATQDTLDATGHAVSVTAVDYRALLGRRLLQAAQDYTAVDEAAAVRALVSYTQGLPGGALGITVGITGAPDTGTVVTRALEPGQTVLDAIQQFARAGDPAVGPGFDWDVAPGWGAARVLRVWKVRGSTSPDRLVYRRRNENTRPDGLNNVAKVSRQFDPSTFANAVRVTGTALTTPALVEAPDIGTRPEGRWETAQQFSELETQDAVNAKAAGILADTQALAPSYTVVLQDGYWRGPDHLGPGDTVRLFIQSGRLTEDVTLRIGEVQVEVSGDGAETVTLTLGTQALASLPNLLGNLDRRLASTERRLRA